MRYIVELVDGTEVRSVLAPPGFGWDASLGWGGLVAALCGAGWRVAGLRVLPQTAVDEGWAD